MGLGAAVPPTASIAHLSGTARNGTTTNQSILLRPTGSSATPVPALTVGAGYLINDTPLYGQAYVRQRVELPVGGSPPSIDYESSNAACYLTIEVLGFEE